MVESSDLQGAIQRTQARERIASLQNQQEELNRKRFELELARQAAEKAKKTQDVSGAESRPVVRDRHDGPSPPEEEARTSSPGPSAGDEADTEDTRGDEDEPGDVPPGGGSLDVPV